MSNSFYDPRSSQDLFDDSLPHENIQSSDGTISENSNCAWRGVELDSLKLLRYDLIPSVVPSSFHCVTFRLPLEEGKCPFPHPKYFHDVWDNSHVHMPCSKSNHVFMSKEKRIPAWPMIKERLSKNLSSPIDIQQAISSYAWRKGYSTWNFTALRQFFSDTLSEPEAEYFFDSVLPDMVDLALSLDSQVTSEIPLLRKRRSFNLSISQRQAACILANAFFCTFPDRNFDQESLPFPSINLTRIFLQGGSNSQEKLKCFINYFRRVCSSNQDGVISFSRRSINPTNLPSWFKSNKQFTKLHITSEGTIDDDADGFLRIDFANKFIGGGILGYGCVQEEITFLLCPELIVSRLFTECLEDTECLIITGAERYNRHTGYADSFKWAGNYEDRTPRDSYKRKCRTIVAIDALHFAKSNVQYKPENIFREINKAYCGFSFGCDGKEKISLATGNWGCGAFGGDPKLKSLIQLVAAAQAERNMVYFTFFDNDLRDSIYGMYTFLVGNNITVGQLCSALSKYQGYVRKIGDIPLYDYLYSSLLSLDEVVEMFDASENQVKEDSTSVNSTNVVNKEQENHTDDNMEENVSPEGPGSPKECSYSEDTSMELALPTNEPISAETYSLQTEEGRKRCIESENERWQAYENAKSQLTPSSDNSDKPVAKRKISDYFSKTPKKL